MKHLHTFPGALCLAVLCLGAPMSWAQEADDESPITDVQPLAEPQPAPASNVRHRVVELQTTVTGNQEQPRVLYILPWQSPRSDAVDIGHPGSQDSPVFGHLERAELQRELEAQGEFD